MKIDGNYRVISDSVDVKALVDAVGLVTEDEWYNDQFRQDRFETAQDVETILFKINTDKGVASDTNVTEEVWDKWRHLVQPVIDEVIKYYPNGQHGFINKCMLPRMRPGSEIPGHYDTADSFTISHRIHVPLITNDEVYFTVGGERVVMEVGKAYEINNLNYHHVINKGDTDRVHLLFDLYIEGEL